KDSIPPRKAATRPPFSPAMEGGRPPLSERGHALGQVGARPCPGERSGHVRVAAEVALEAIQHELVARDGERRQLRDLPRPTDGVVETAEPVHEPEPVGGLTVE